MEEKAKSQHWCHHELQWCLHRHLVARQPVKKATTDTKDDEVLAMGEELQKLDM